MKNEVRTEAVEVKQSCLLSTMAGVVVAAVVTAVVLLPASAVAQGFAREGSPRGAGARTWLEERAGLPPYSPPRPGADAAVPRPTSLGTVPARQVDSRRFDDIHVERLVVRSGARLLQEESDLIEGVSCGSPTRT
ncbi:MAG: hypothetical protein EXQ59_04120 [Acidobacteria bacterium]|nr:hypothetical protein [Acidobacteriota bacterium]